MDYDLVKCFSNRCVFVIQQDDKTCQVVEMGRRSIPLCESSLITTAARWYILCVSVCQRDKFDNSGTV